ncbi:uncharacterized protein EI90DRAFT_849078 [Cantharellus anzutake]|uniref:uncharacterized protein n=1 Tax=Cantharellus anzutake TaxID=1750568 RepID=UPI001903CDBD|nr:uncharacterized protein EI90DRAFT_849078 [Cantharellus anzutake]KAF8332343.1 hypothetical protein EI90DRAFT_849078 [Cantharellus anzutake]
MPPLFRGNIEGLLELINSNPPVGLPASVFSREVSDPYSALVHLSSAQIISWKCLEPKHSSGSHLVIMQLHSIALSSTLWLRFERSADPSIHHPTNPSSHIVTLSSNPNLIRPGSDQHKSTADISLERFTVMHFIDLFNIVLEVQRYWYPRDSTASQSSKWFANTMTHVIQNLGTNWMDNGHGGESTLNHRATPEGFRQKLCALFDRDYVSPATQELYILRRLLQNTRGDQLYELDIDNVESSGSRTPTLANSDKKFLLLSPCSSESIPPYDPNSSLSQRYVRAAHEFQGPQPGDLSFLEGDLIELLDFGDGNWWRGRLGNAVGAFPRNYVERVSSLRSLQAITDFNPLHPSWEGQFNWETGLPQTYLSFRKGDIIEFVGTTHDISSSDDFSQEEWFVGQIGDSIGLLPKSCVEAVWFPDDEKCARKPSSTKFKVLSTPTSPTSLTTAPPPYPPSPSPPSLQSQMELGTL